MQHQQHNNKVLDAMFPNAEMRGRRYWIKMLLFIRIALASGKFTGCDLIWSFFIRVLREPFHRWRVDWFARARAYCTWTAFIKHPARAQLLRWVEWERRLWLCLYMQIRRATNLFRNWLISRWSDRRRCCWDDGLYAIVKRNFIIFLERRSRPGSSLSKSYLLGPLETSPPWNPQILSYFLLPTNFYVFFQFHCCDLSDLILVICT